MTDTRTQVIDNSSKANQLVVDNSSKTTELYNTIYQSLFESQTTTDHDDGKRNVDVLKPDFNNVKLRNIILMLLLANNVKLDSNVAFKLESDSYFALQQQLMENNHGRELSKEQNISFKKQKGSEVHYVNLLSDLEIQTGNLIFKFSKDTESFKIIKKMAQELQKEVEEFNICFNTSCNMRQCLELVYGTSFTPDKDNNSYSDFILEVMLPIIIQLAYTGIQKTSPELITKIISGQYNNIIQQRIAQLLNDALQNNQKLPELTLNNLLDENLVKVYDIKSFIDSEHHTYEDKKEKLKEAIEIAMKSKNIEVSEVIFEIIKKYQEYTIQSIYDKLRELYPKLTINDKYKERINNIINNIISYPSSYFSFLSDYLNNILDENLVNVYNIAELFNDLKEHPLTNWQIKQIDQICGMVEVAEIARTTENPEVLKTIMEQKYFKFDLNILFAISNNKNTNRGILEECIVTLECICARSEIKDIQEQCIKAIIKILDNKNYNSDISHRCIQAFGCIGFNSKFQDAQKQCIEEIIKIFENEIKKMSDNKNPDKFKLFTCINTLEYIGVNSTIQETQKQCIEKIMKIIKNIEKQEDKDIVQFVFSKCIGALGSIGAKSKFQETQKQCIDTLKYIFTNFQIQETQKQCIERIKEIAENKIIKIPNNNSYILSYCIDTLKYIGEKFENSEIKGKCIEAIKEISQNIKFSSFFLDSSSILNKCKIVIKELDAKVSTEKQQNETQEQNYANSEKKYPESNTAIIVSGSDDQSDNNKNQSVVLSVAQSNNHVDNQSKKEQDNTKSGGMQFGK